VGRVVFKMWLHDIDGRAHCLDAPVARWASHLLVEMTIQGVFDRDANPLATPFHFAAIVHLVDIRGLWRSGKPI
jgi:hypothetical protein